MAEGIHVYAAGCVKLKKAKGGVIVGAGLRNVNNQSARSSGGHKEDGIRGLAVAEQAGRGVGCISRVPVTTRDCAGSNDSQQVAIGCGSTQARLQH